MCLLQPCTCESCNMDRVVAIDQSYSSSSYTVDVCCNAAKMYMYSSIGVCVWEIVCRPVVWWAVTEELYRCTHTRF